MKINLVKYRIEYCAIGNMELPEFSGSTFRGVFGHALKQLACLNLNEDCSNCELSQQCIYTNIFETKPPIDDIPPFPGMNHIPHPFVLRPEIGMNSRINRNESFALELNIFGQFIEWSHYFLKALQNMGKMGAGKKNGKFKLIQIIDRVTNSIIYKNNKWEIEPEIESLSLVSESPESVISLQTNSLLRFVKKGRVLKELTPEILFKEASRRFKLLAHYYGEVDDAYDYKSMIDSAKNIKFKSNLSLKKISRYSNRRNKFIAIDGFTGSIIMENVPAMNYALLKILEETHLGKGTAMGLGHLKISKS